MIRAGIVSQSMWRMWSKSFTPPIAAARFVVSDNGESLSPKNAPEMTAPATRGAGKPIPSPMAMNAMPTVAMVVSELPKTSDTTAGTRQASAEKIMGGVAGTGEWLVAENGARSAGSGDEGRGEAHTFANGHECDADSGDGGERAA